MALNFMKITLNIFAFLFLFVFADQLQAQYSHNITGELEIPDIVDIESSQAHLYILSESEGLVVYRTYPDSLQWLYTSKGMQRRGNHLEADIRFAYLFGNGRRLTVIEPTSVLGVYSSTVLPAPPVSVRRVGNLLYVVMEDGSLGSLSLETPESVDSAPAPVDPDRLDGRTINDLATNANRVLYVLSNNRAIDIYRFSSGEENLEYEERVELDEPVNKLFFTGTELIGSNPSGEIFLIDSDGRTRFQADAEQAIHKIQFWNDEIVVKTEENELWIGKPGESLTQWKENQRAGNHFTVNHNNLYVTEFNSIFPVIRESVNEDGANNQGERTSREFTIEPIETVTLPFPKPLIIPLEVTGYEGNKASITFSAESSLDNLQIRGNSLYWQPGASNTGRHQILVSATTPEGNSTQTSFTVDLRPFNSPPRFTPARLQSIPVEEPFEMQISAFDPDGTHPELIRYLGVDLPSGASIDEQTGTFTWEPSIRQVGEHQFRVIATDQFGAAASQNYTINVLEVSEEEEPVINNTIDS